MTPSQPTPLDLDEDEDDPAEIIYQGGVSVATILLNRPDYFNAWTPNMEDQLRAALEQAAEDPKVRAVVITGAGPGFCMGADLKSASPRRAPTSGVGGFDQRYTYLLNHPKLLVAALNGPAIGVGLCLALYCDLRFMAEGAKLSTAFSRRGLIAEHGAAWLLPRLIGPMNAMDLLVSGRMVETDEAAAMGLVRALPAQGFRSAVCTAVDQLVLAASPRSLRIIKRQIYEALDQRLGDAVLRAHEEQALSFESHDFREGVAALKEGRAPQFTGR